MEIGGRVFKLITWYAWTHTHTNNSVVIMFANRMMMTQSSRRNWKCSSHSLKVIWCDSEKLEWQHLIWEFVFRAGCRGVTFKEEVTVKEEVAVNDKKQSFVGGRASSPYNIDPALLLRWTEKKGNINVFYNLLGLILNPTCNSWCSI